MLLTKIESDKEGRLTGQLERGGRVTLHCPHPKVFLGQRNTSLTDEGFDEIGLGILTGDLVRIAREDRNHYYFIGEQERTKRGILVVPYLVF